MGCLNLLKADFWSEKTLVSDLNLFNSNVIQKPLFWVRLTTFPPLPPDSGTSRERNGMRLQIFTMPTGVKAAYSMEYNNVYTETWNLKVHPWRERLFAITADEVNFHS